MGARYEMFRAKYPLFKLQGFNPPVSGPIGQVGSTVDGTSEQAVHDTPGITEPATPADMDWLTEVHHAGTELPPPKVWEIPGGSGSGGGSIPGGSGEGESGVEPGHIYEEPIIHEIPPIIHGEKKKRARRGQGFGPRRD